jgi:pyrroloquinoline quinone biosynthesis protein E
MTPLETAEVLAPPIGLLAELTHRCPLQCLYCSNPLELTRARDELDTHEWVSVIQQAGSLGALQLHLSGGEPMARRDLETLVGAARTAGLYSNLITSGYSGAERLPRLAEAGLDHVQISVQAATSETADRVAGTKGAHERKVSFAKAVKSLGLALTLNAPAHRINLGELDAIIEMAVTLEADRLEVAHVQYYGWGLENRDHLLPTPEQVRQSVIAVEAARQALKGRLTIDFVAPDYWARTPKACMGGWGRKFLVVSPSGNVLPCHAATSIPHLTFESVRARSLADIWAKSDAFNAYRGFAWMREPCVSCDLKTMDFGGCRCQALALTGDAANTDPTCVKSPMRDKVRALAAAAVAGETVTRSPQYRTYRASPGSKAVRDGVD